MEWELVVVLALVLGVAWVVLSTRPISSWPDKKLVDFIMRNSDLRNRLRIEQLNMDQNIASAKAKEYRELDEKIKQAELEIEKRRSRPVVMTPDAALWLEQNSELASQIAALQNVDINQAKQIMIEKRRAFLDHFAGHGSKEQSIKTANSCTTELFRDRVRSKKVD